MGRSLPAVALHQGLPTTSDSDDLDHERDIILAIHAAVPDLIRDNRPVMQAGSGCLMALARRFEWNSLAKPV
jgi:hypothetical protein